MTSSAKISFVDPKNRQEDDYSDPKTESTNQQNNYKSLFVSTTANKWKALVDSTLDPTQDPTLDPASGQSIPSDISDLTNNINSIDPPSDTTPSPVGDMMDAINGVEQQNTYYGPIDEMSANMVLVDPRIPNPLLQDREITYVPDLYKDLFKSSPGLMDDMKPVVDKYEALIKTIDQQLKNDYYALKQPMSLVETDATQKEVEVLKANKLRAEGFLENAKYYLYLQKLREKAAAADDANN